MRQRRDAGALAGSRLVAYLAFANVAGSTREAARTFIMIGAK